MAPPDGKKANGTSGEASKATESGSGNLMSILGLGLVIALAVSVAYDPGSAKSDWEDDVSPPKKEAPRKLVSEKNSASKPKAAPEPKEETQKPPQKEKKRRPKVQEFALHIPRVTLAELHQNHTLKTGHHAFILTDIINSSWQAKDWTLKYLKNKIPFEWVDYYPQNMREVGNKPYLMTLDKAIPDFLKDNGHAKYMQMRISLRGWKRIRKDFTPMPDHPTFWDDGTWIRECMKKEDGKPDEKAIDNFFTTNQWKFLLIGQKGTSMFFHKDHTAASSWQAQIMGRKSWTLCPNTESRFLDVEIDTYNPDYKRFPKFARALCGQVTVNMGEMVYYPGYWWHHTLQRDKLNIAYTGALVGNEAPRDDLGGGDTKVHKQFYRDLQEKCSKCWTPGKKERHCDDISLKWPGAAPPMMRKVCDDYLPKCLKLWDANSESLWRNSESEDEAGEVEELGEFA